MLKSTFDIANIFMTNRQQSTFFFLIVFLFACGAGLLIYKQYDSYYQEKAAIDLEASASFPERLVKQKTSAPTVLADGRLQVDSPKEGDTVGQTFTVSGYAQDWFEGNIAIKVFDDSNQLLYQDNAIAGDNYGHPAPFTASVTLAATSTTPSGRIEFNDYSAKDGSLVYQKVVKIRFAGYDVQPIDETGPESICKSNADCWCRSFNGAKFYPGKVQSACNTKTYRCVVCRYE
jgi:hypothetical protein